MCACKCVSLGYWATNSLTSQLCIIIVSTYLLQLYCTPNPLLCSPHTLTVTMLLHRQLCFRADSGDSEQHVKGISRLVREVGNVTADSEVFLEFGRIPQRTEEDMSARSLAADIDCPSEVPFQVQIEFTKPCGMRCLRVLTDTQRTTADKSKCEKVRKCFVHDDRGLEAC